MIAKSAPKGSETLQLTPCEKIHLLEKSAPERVIRRLMLQRIHVVSCDSGNLAEIE
jgi:hypothetical protein